MPQSPFRHAYLFGANVLDPLAVYGAAEALAAHKGEHGKYRAGHLFADGPVGVAEARRMIDALIRQWSEQVASTTGPQGSWIAQRLLNLRHARTHLRPADSTRATGKRKQAGDSEAIPHVPRGGRGDKLYLIAHGNARDVAGLAVKTHERQGPHTRGWLARHDIEDVALRLAGLIQRHPTVGFEEIRLMSCGSGGPVRLVQDPVQGPRFVRETPSPAGRLSGALRGMIGSRAPRVLGYAGDQVSGNRPAFTPLTSSRTPGLGPYRQSSVFLPDLEAHQDPANILQRFMLWHGSPGPALIEPHTVSSSQSMPTPGSDREASFTPDGRRRVRVARFHFQPMIGSSRRYATRSTPSAKQRFVIRARRSATRMDPSAPPPVSPRVSAVTTLGPGSAVTSID